MEIAPELGSTPLHLTSLKTLDGCGPDDDPPPTSVWIARSKRPNCVWCGRSFRQRLTGGSAQRFCSTEHRKAFWTAARRWTMLAIEMGLLSVDCLKVARAAYTLRERRFDVSRRLLA